MIDDEKQIMCALLMEDIRGNWGWNLGQRVTKLMELASKLDNEAIISAIDSFDWQDGRHFRTSWPYGYENTPFEINRDLKSYSEEFQKFALQYLTYPEHRFDGIFKK